MYKRIEDYGIIGDLRTVALVGLDGSIDWCCFPNFDSPSIFAALLDAGKGGHFRIQVPPEMNARRKQLYIPDTNVLVTRFLSKEGVGEVTDFMPVETGRGIWESDGRRRIVRRVTSVRGVVHFQLHCFPAFDYARRRPTVHKVPHGYVFADDAGPLSLELLSPVDLQVDEEQGGVHGVFELSPGETIVFVLQEHEEGRLYPTADPDMDQGYLSTLHFWQDWLAQCNYQGRWREMVHRSALVLKLLTFQPTGAIVAAPTTSLPEVIGGQRNWDYRYTWIRDASFTVYGFLRIGFTEEATQFMHWLEERLHHLGNSGDHPLQLMYRIDGSRDLHEEILEHLEGYMQSEPVRIGNGAYDQLQLDIYGALMDAIYLFDKHAQPLSYDLWKSVRTILDWLCENWNQPDEGIWEVRDSRRNFVYSRLMCWVALDRGIRLSNKRSYPADRERWIAVRDEIYLEIMERGWSKERRAFVQSYENDALDASNLLMPLVFFLSAQDPRMQSTIDAVIGELASDSLVYRYIADHAPDGLDGEEGSFSMCTFWLVEALARGGRVEEARVIFEKMIGYANHVGLYSEEIGPFGEALGNFPQAFTHLGLISAAFNLDRALDHKKT